MLVAVQLNVGLTPGAPHLGLPDISAALAFTQRKTEPLLLMGGFGFLRCVVLYVIQSEQGLVKRPGRLIEGNVR